MPVQRLSRLQQIRRLLEVSPPVFPLQAHSHPAGWLGAARTLWRWLVMTGLRCVVALACSSHQNEIERKRGEHFDVIFYSILVWSLLMLGEEH